MACACSFGAKITSRPSQARYSGSSPSIPQTPFTFSCTGISPECRRIPTWLCPAISYNTVPTPPRVASRITWISFVTVSISSTAPQSGAQSLVTSASIPKSSLSSRIVQPCRPISPLTITASPGSAFFPEVSTPSCT